MSSGFLNMSGDGDSSTSLGRWFQQPITPSVKNFFLTFNLKLPWHSSGLFCQCCLGEQTNPTWPQPPFKELWSDKVTPNKPQTGVDPVCGAAIPCQDVGILGADYGDGCIKLSSWFKEKSLFHCLIAQAATVLTWTEEWRQEKTVAIYNWSLDPISSGVAFVVKFG